ncbi:MAG: glycosyltransferase family A protein [bacterium]
MNSITIAIQCHNFQKRLSLMLSSILAQEQKEMYNLIIDVAHYSQNGIPSTEKVINYFKSKNLNIISRSYKDYDRFKYRGFTRNDQIINCSTNYILFADSDMIYHNEFFHKLMSLLKEDDQYKNYEGIMTCGRWSQNNNLIENTNIFVDNLIDKDPIYIENIWYLSDSKLDKVKRRNCGAGFFQLINMDLCEHENFYVNEDKCRDYNWDTKGQKAKSDQQFKRRIGLKKKLPGWYSKSQIHLNHFRDSMVGKHIETQR